MRIKKSRLLEAWQFKKHKWHKWFAWYPVRIGDEWVWLERVWRSLDVKADWDAGWKTWSYLP